MRGEGIFVEGHARGLGALGFLLTTSRCFRYEKTGDNQVGGLNGTFTRLLIGNLQI